MSFGIHALPVGGGTLALAPMPGRGGDLAADLVLVMDMAPTVVVSMTERPEMGPADGMAERLRAAGIGWRHFPVADFGVPDAGAGGDWPALSGTLRAVLAGGGGVLLHCMGGCGRSGMVALRLMVECGEAPAAALARLRAVRPCAVETPAQLDWAIQQAGGPDASDQPGGLAASDQAGGLAASDQASGPGA